MDRTVCLGMVRPGCGQAIPAGDAQSGRPKETPNRKPRPESPFPLAHLTSAVGPGWAAQPARRGRTNSVIPRRKARQEPRTGLGLFSPFDALISWV